MDGASVGRVDATASLDGVILDGNPVLLLHRHIVQERLRRLFARGARVLDLGPRPGDDAAFLEAIGVRVHEPREGLSGLDGAYSPLGGLSAPDLPRVGARVEHAVRPGGGVLLCVSGPTPLPALVERALTGKGQSRGGAERRESGAEPAEFVRPAEARRLLGATFRWTSLHGLGILIAGSDRAEWTRRSPQAFGVLAALEGIVRSWPGLRGLGDHFILEGRVAEGRRD